MNKKELFKKIGSIEQLAYARPIVYREGRSEWMNAIEVKCGDLQFHAQTDKCLDLADLSYKGVNLSFMAKTGLEGRNPYDTNGFEAQRSIMCGFFFTCGLESICTPYEENGKAYPMHGRMRTTPAEHVGSDVVVDDAGNVKVILKGEAREAELFGENMLLRRTIETSLGDNTITLTDEIENQSYREEPMMLMYHCNMGYPFLDENSELIAPSKSVRGREDFSEEHKEGWMHMDPPADNAREYVYIHELATDEEQNTKVLFINPELEIGLIISYNTKHLPYFNEWKSTASGDYVVGLEPANGIPMNRKYHEEHGMLHTLQPFEKETHKITFTVIEGKEKIEAAKKEIEQLNN